MGFKPTKEQQDIIDKAMYGDDLRINAFAGASKTTTLSLIAQEKHNAGGEVGMYLAFNKVTALEAEGRFPNSVDCRTVHSLAYQKTPKALIAKLKLPKIFNKEFESLYNLKGKFISHNDSEKYVSIGNIVSMINRTVSRFCNSADKELGYKHLVPIEWMKLPAWKDAPFKEVFDMVVESAQKHWENIIDPNSMVPLTHEAYLKLYSMQGRAIIADYIMIDENQDSSPVILAIVEAQKKAQKIYVGDRFQAIYGWRGAINAMDIVTGDECFLTKSFRFGDNVEFIANQLLKVAGNTMPLKGNGSNVGKLYFGGMGKHPDAVICRTNASVIFNIFEFRNKYPNKTIGASCDLREIEKFVYSYIDLLKGKQVDHPLLFGFGSIAELRKYCSENSEDLEISGMVKLIDEFTPSGLIKAVKSCDEEKNPDIMVTTAHKSKGLEWDNVEIFGDFFYDIGEDGRLDIDNEELNLLYVACTRAKLDMDISGIMDLVLNIVNGEDDKMKLRELCGSDPFESDAVHPEFIESTYPDDEYGDDDVARATGGVTVMKMLEVERKGDDENLSHLALTDFEEG